MVFLIIQALTERRSYSLAVGRAGWDIRADSGPLGSASPPSSPPHLKANQDPEREFSHPQSHSRAGLPLQCSSSARNEVASTRLSSRKELGYLQGKGGLPWKPPAQEVEPSNRPSQDAQPCQAEGEESSAEQRAHGQGPTQRATYSLCPANC